MSINKAIRVILLVVVLVGGSFYHLYNLPESKSYEISVLDKWESESCGKRSCNAKYVIKYKVTETGHVDQMVVLHRDYLNFNKGSVANYTLGRSEVNDVSVLSFILQFLCFLIILFFGIFVLGILIGYIIMIISSIIDWEFDIDDFKFWNWKV